MNKGKEGIALILVVSILTVVAITVVSFIFTMRLESRSASNYLWQQKASYLAQAGIAHARALLKEDKENDFLDSYLDSWRSTFSGNDIDNNDDAETDSRWIEVVSDGQAVGRYAVLVEDESSKININTAGFHNESPLKATQGASPFEVSLKDFFLAKQISLASNLASAVIDYRWGKDQAPGEKDKDDNQNQVVLSNDGIDNDADGEIDEAGEGLDEPAEFTPFYPYDDDRPFLTTGEIKRLAQVSPSIYNKIKSQITVHSQTASTNCNRDLQWDINSIGVQELLDVFLRSGVSSPWQKALNLIDFADTNFAQSLVMKSTLPLYAPNQGPNGDWEWHGDHYQSKTYGGLKGLWTWTNISAGEYFLILHGTEESQLIGDVTLGELTQTHLVSGETFNVFASGTVTVAEAAGGKGSLTIAIQNNEALGTICFFKYIELCSAEGKMLGEAEAEKVRGTEGIRINELMIKPVIELAASPEQAPGGHWSWVSDHYENSASGGGPAGEGNWIWQDIPDGEYYLTVFASEDEQIVGDVKWQTALQENMHSQERFTKYPTVTVSGGTFRLDIQNNLSSGTCYFKSLLLSQQPDAEFIELVNLTPNEVSLGGFSLKASATDGWPASIPLGSTIGPGEYLILAVDKEDNASGINNNGISFKEVWGNLPAVQLDFSNFLTAYSDMIEDAPAAGKGEIILCDNQGNIVDIQEYPPAQIKPYISLEKGDPTYVGAAENVWFVSKDLSGATPAKKNNNAQIIEEKAGQTIVHSLDEVTLNNRSLANLGEITQVTSGGPWQKIKTEDLANVADRLTVYSLRLEAEGHKKEGDWSEQLRQAPLTAWFISQENDQVGSWLWDEQERIPNGVYILTLYGKQAEAVAVSLHLADGTWTPFTPALTPGVNNEICLGRIEIGRENANSLPAHKIEMRLKNVSASKFAYFDYIHLAPLPEVAGKININTASLEVLEALPKIDRESAQRIIEARPLGNKESRACGIGDLLREDILDSDPGEGIAKFSAIANLITVRSNTFQIIVSAEALRNGRVMAQKRIRVVVER